MIIHLNLEQVGVLVDVGRLDEVLLDGQRDRVAVLGGWDNETGRSRLWRFAQLVHDLRRREHRTMVVLVAYLYSHLQSQLVSKPWLVS